MNISDAGVKIRVVPVDEIQPESLNIGGVTKYLLLWIYLILFRVMLIVL